MEKSVVFSRREMTLQVKVLWAVAAIVAAVTLPQLLHTVGIISGSGAALGEIFLPMHLPVMLAGFFAGPVVGLTVGVCAPVISYFMTGMPNAALLPFMAVELLVYGLSSGLIKDVQIPSILKVLSVQITGRAVRGALIMGAVLLFGFDRLDISIIWLSVKTGFIGILIQLIVIPILVRIQGASR